MPSQPLINFLADSFVPICCLIVGQPNISNNLNFHWRSCSYIALALGHFPPNFILTASVTNIHRRWYRSHDLIPSPNPRRVPFYAGPSVDVADMVYAIPAQRISNQTELPALGFRHPQLFLRLKYRTKTSEFEVTGYQPISR